MTRLGLRLAAAALLAFGLVSCSPWTVRPIDDGRSNSAAAATSPSAYVDGMWSTKLLPAVLTTAVDARQLLEAMRQSPAAARTQYARQQPGGAAYWIVKGQGRVITVDSHSRVGLIQLAATPPGARPDISIQCGPLLRGTSLRDATGLVNFSDFANQLQYADVGNELNERVLKTVLAPLPIKALRGRRVSFAGAAPADEGEPAIHDLIPVRLEVEENR